MTQEAIEFYQDPTHFVRITCVQRFDDGSGYRGTLDLGSQPFACEGYDFFFDHLARFHKQMVSLRRKLKGSARLGADYEPDFVRFETTERGHLVVSAQIEDCSQSVKFAFESDQTYLGPLIDSIELTLRSLGEGV